MKALILAGGEGTRLRPLTLTTPKPLLPIANRPHLAHILDLLARHHLDEAVLMTGFGAERFDGFEGPPGVALTFVREPEPLGTSGPVKVMEDELDATFLVFNGDVLTGADLTAMIAQHRRSGAAATLALAAVDDVGPYGLVPLDADGRVQAFLEKPPANEASGGRLVNAGTYVLEPQVLKHVHSGPSSFERELFPALLEAGEPVYGFPVSSYWIDIGTPERYLQAHWDILEGRVPHVAATPPSGLRVAAQGIGRRVVLGDRCEVAAGARVSGSVLLDGSRLAPGSRVEGSILGYEVVVEAGATIEGSVVGDGCRIRSGCRVRGARLDPGSLLPPDSIVEA